jgi:chromatin segregation and condensation protein Rec8/ScpA/Scc1 (kleisin family)
MLCVFSKTSRILNKKTQFLGQIFLKSKHWFQDSDNEDEDEEEEDDDDDIPDKDSDDVSEDESAAKEAPAAASQPRQRKPVRRDD